VTVKSHGIIVRALYYIFIGWWFGLLWALLSWVMYATVIGAPLGIKMLNRVPGAISLKAREKELRVTAEPSGYHVEQARLKQRTWWVRLIYYPFGLVFSLLLILLAWLLCAFLVTLPLGIILFNKVPAVASLARQ
jgi:hypothetical protein